MRYSPLSFYYALLLLGIAGTVSHVHEVSELCHVITMVTSHGMLINLQTLPLNHLYVHHLTFAGGDVGAEDLEIKSVVYGTRRGSSRSTW